VIPVKQCDQGSEAAERYVAGSMSEPERAGFEDHFFACHDCFRTVQGLEDARRVLVENAFPETRKEAGGAGRISGHGLPYPWMAAAAALAIVAGLSPMVRRGSNPPQAPAATRPVTASPAPQPEVISPTRLPAAPAAPPQGAAMSTARESAGGRLERWAAVTPPQYVSLTTRSGQDQEADLTARAFDEAMSHYSAGRYRQAADGLDAIAAREPAAAHIHFFLGISELMTGNVARARGALQRSADAGTTPYSDEAHFYLAKAALRAGDLTTAARELEIAVDREAGPNGEAARLLAEMRKGK
jgi:TolA-binding protein